MKIKLALAAVCLCALAGPALAQQVGVGFYIVQDPATKRCTIVDQRPTTTTTTTIVGGDTVYKTRTEAETGLKTVKVCTTN